MITPHLDAAVEFLQAWKPGGPWLLAAFHEDRDKMTPARQFDASSIDMMRSWIKEVQADEFNVYFHVNTCRDGLEKKAAKTDVQSLDWLHVDVDPIKGKDIRAEQKRILAELERSEKHLGLPKPTVITFSGGGYQAFWKLEQPETLRGDMNLIAEAERYNIQIAQLFGGDNCHNADRIMRLPGTVNWPNAQKRANGQEPVVAEIVRASWNLAYPLSRFYKAPDRQEKNVGVGGGKNRPKVELPSGNVRRIAPDQLLDELAPYGISDEDPLPRIILEGEDTEAAFKPGADRSRSGVFLYVVCELVRNNVPDELIYSIVTDPAYKISAHPIGQGRGRDRAVHRALVKAKEEKIDPWLASINEEYAVVESVGGRLRILCERFNHANGRMELEFHQKDGFVTMHANKFTDVPAFDKKGNPAPPVKVNVGKWWLSHENRREYRDVTFFPGRDFPGTLNLWRGFNVDAIPGDCTLYLDHIKNVLCRGNEEYYTYLIRWMAYAVQHPYMPGHVAVVLRGGQGTGKGTFARHFGHLFGMHYKHIVNPDHVTGQFNSTLRDAALVFADECFVTGNRRQTSALKALITEEKLRTEQKGLDSMETRNCVSLIMATNSEWAVAAELDDRRFFVLNVGDDHKQDANYFQAMEDQMNNGGHEALMHFLLTMDLSGFNVRHCPKTEELRVQQDKTLMGTMRGYLLECLTEGVLSPNHNGWRGRVIKDEFMDGLYHYTDNRNDKVADVTRFLAQFLNSSSRDVQIRTKGTAYLWKPLRGGGERTSERFFVFPSLAKCRRLWDEQFGPRDWPDVGGEDPDEYEPEAGDGDGHF